MGKTKRGKGTKIMGIADRHGLPLALRTESAAPAEVKLVTATLEARIAATEARFRDEDVPRPPHWSGYRLTPRSLEFWRDRPFRLHERLVFERAGEGWATRRLFP